MQVGIKKRKVFRPLSLIIITIVFLLAVSGTIQIIRANSKIDIFVNGQQQVRPSGTTLESIVSAHKKEFTGDLYDVNGGLIKKQAGKPPVVKLNGKEVNPATVLDSKDRIEILKGGDALEDIKVQKERIAFSLKQKGMGSLLRLSTGGQAGEKVIIRGGISGKVLKVQVTDPTPGVIQRYKVKTPEKVVALTFDDGPYPHYTAQVLAVLNKYHIKGTFFMIGKHLKAHPEIGRKVVAAGQEVGNHTYDHVILNKLPNWKIKKEIEDNHKLIQQTLGVTPVTFRPPQGKFTGAAYEVIKELGYQMVLWDVDTLDWAGRSSGQIQQAVFATTTNGAIILMHDGGGKRTQTVAALPKVIETLMKKGYRFVTVSELMGVKRI